MPKRGTRRALLETRPNDKQAKRTHKTKFLELEMGVCGVPCSSKDGAFAVAGRGSIDHDG